MWRGHQIWIVSTGGGEAVVVGFVGEVLSISYFLQWCSIFRCFLWLAVVHCGNLNVSWVQVEAIWVKSKLSESYDWGMIVLGLVRICLEEHVGLLKVDG